MPVPVSIGEVVDRLQDRIDALPAELDHRRIFIQTYQRTTRAVGAAVEAGFFEDPDWVVRWDVAFADLFLVAHDHDRLAASGRPAPPVPRPWRLAFAASEELPTLAHLLLGMNAHINYDLPQALLQVISEQDFTDPELLDRRRRDHERIDSILTTRVAAEDRELGGSRTLRGPADDPGEPIQLAPVPAGVAAEGLAERGGPARGPGRPDQRPTRPGWRSWNCWLRPRSLICWRPAPRWSSWRSPASASPCRHPDRVDQPLRATQVWPGLSGMIWPSASRNRSGPETLFRRQVPVIRRPSR